MKKKGKETQPPRVTNRRLIKAISAYMRGINMYTRMFAEEMERLETGIENVYGSDGALLGTRKRHRS